MLYFDRSGYCVWAKRLEAGSYAVLEYVRPLIKRRDTQAVVAVPAPQGVLEGSRADVSFCAGMVVDKFVYHLPQAIAQVQAQVKNLPRLRLPLLHF